jgi:hypothetical protein
LQGFYDLLAILPGVILDEHAVPIGFYNFSRTTNYLEKMSQGKRARFLLRRSSKVNKDEALESATPEVRVQAEDLSSLVDGLPLAVVLQKTAVSDQRGQTVLLQRLSVDEKSPVPTSC